MHITICITVYTSKTQSPEEKNEKDKKRFPLEKITQKQMNVPFGYKHVHLQNTHVASIRRKKASS